MDFTFEILHNSSHGGFICKFLHPKVWGFSAFFHQLCQNPPTSQIFHGLQIPPIFWLLGTLRLTHHRNHLHSQASIDILGMWFIDDGEKSNSLAKTICIYNYIYIWYMCICQYGRCKLMLNYYCLLLCTFLYSCLLTLLFTNIVYIQLWIYWWCLLMPTVNPQPKDWNLIRLVTKAGFSSKLFSYWLQGFHFR